MQEYLELSEIYDGLMSHVNYKGWARYIKRIFEINEVKPKELLELACGTGNLTRHIAGDKYNVTAVDISENMLSLAQNKCCKINNLQFLKRDMREFIDEDKFEVVVSVYDSINHLITDEDLFSCFQNVYKALKSGGIFIFDINSETYLERMGGEKIIYDREEYFSAWEIEFDSERRIAEFIINAFVKREECYSKLSSNIKERAWKDLEIREMLDKAGFKKTEAYDCFTFDKASDEDKRVNYIAFK